MLLKGIRLGTNDKQRSRAFYDATFAELGVAPSASSADYPVVIYQLPGGQAFILGHPRDGEAATYANGGTILFEAGSDDTVKAWHAAGLAHGGADEGQPEPKPRANGAFGAYLRDPDGNKLGCYHALSID